MLSLSLYTVYDMNFPFYNSDGDLIFTVIAVLFCIQVSIDCLIERLAHCTSLVRLLSSLHILSFASRQRGIIDLKFGLVIAIITIRMLKSL